MYSKVRRRGIYNSVICARYCNAKYGRQVIYKLKTVLLLTIKQAENRAIKQIWKSFYLIKVHIQGEISH